MLYWNRLLDPKRERAKPSAQRASNDYRSPFKKDFDTICNSTILRRLQDKAQVFPLEEEDYARTRLTHSIEVMSIAESLGIQAMHTIYSRQNQAYLIEPDNDRSQSMINEVRKSIDYIPTILMGAALLHDMGNPPFGHLGEKTINDWFEDKLKHYEYKTSEGKYGYVDASANTLFHVLSDRHRADLTHFDGNAQLLRLVSKLNFVVDEKGMNLTYPLMATIVKYPCSSEEIKENILSKKKTGYFDSEKELFEDIGNTLGLKTDLGYCRHPLAFLLEAADDIAYLTADIEDAHHKGIISIDDIILYLDLYAEKDPFANKIKSARKIYQKEAQNLGYPNNDDYIMHRLRVYIKGQMANAMATAFKDSYSDIMSGKCETELLDNSNACVLTRALRELEKEKIHYCPEIIKGKMRSTVIISKMLDYYVPAILNYNRNQDHEKDTFNNIIYSCFSENYRFICNNSNKNVTEDELLIYNKLRLVVDQITGMTDSRAMSTYRMLSAT